MSYFTSIPSVDPSDRERIIASGSEAEKAILAMQADLSPRHALQLAGDPSLKVAKGIIHSASTPESLDLLVATHPEILSFAGVDVNASTELKLNTPFYEQTEYSLSFFLRDVGATTEQQQELYRRHRQGTPPGGPLLREVWDEVRGKQARG